MIRKFVVTAAGVSALAVTLLVSGATSSAVTVEPVTASAITAQSTPDALDPAAFDAQSTTRPVPVAYAQPPEKSPTPEPTPEPTQAPTREPQRASQPAPAPTQAGPTVISLAPVTALRDQSVLDQGHLVTWFDGDPICLVAGHDTDGWHWLANIAKGTHVYVTTGPCAGKYEVVAHHWSSNRGGPVLDEIRGYDLVLQTCVRSGGTGFSLAKRTG